MAAISSTITLRVPMELKDRLNQQAELQGVSTNQLASYMLNFELTHLEGIRNLHERLERKSLPAMKKRVSAILDRVPPRPVPNWDRG